MTEYPVFKSAPITEALLDIRVSLPSEIDLNTLASLQSRVIDRYPLRNDRVQWEIQANIAETTEPTLSRTGGQIGYLFLPPAAHQDRSFQSRLDGFTFSKLKPYETWNAFREEAKELWDIYTETTRPQKIHRLALRTINSLDLPLPFDDFKEYLLTTPEVAPGIPSGLSHFFMQMAIPQPGGEVAVVTSAMQPLRHPQEQFVTVIFDIDVFIEESFPVEASAIWEKFERLHLIRNEIFFSSLTDKAKGLF